MTQVIHMRCRHCGKRLIQRTSPYCPSCNLALCYRAMPILLGMLMTGQQLPATTRRPISQSPARGYDDASVLMWE